MPALLGDGALSQGMTDYLVYFLLFVPLTALSEGSCSGAWTAAASSHVCIGKAACLQQEITKKPNNNLTFKHTSCKILNV